MSYVAAPGQIERARIGDLAQSLPFGSTDPVADDISPQHEIDIRQLRHHTKNTLQRIIGLIGESTTLLDSPEGARIARELEHRICLSATISNALFGLTDKPGSMADRLRQLGGGIVDMLRAESQTVRIGVSVKGTCPVYLRQAVVRAANELIGNAVKHGLKGRPSGRISVRLVNDGSSTTLTIVDNGWGFSGRPREGEGLALARNFAEACGGTLSINGNDGTVAALELPHWR